MQKAAIKVAHYRVALNLQKVLWISAREEVRWRHIRTMIRHAMIYADDYFWCFVEPLPCPAKRH